MLQFQNRYQAINYYKKKLLETDQELQDWLTHNEKIKNEKIQNTMKEIKKLNDLIDWNKSEIKKESFHQIKNFEEEK